MSEPTQKTSSILRAIRDFDPSSPKMKKYGIKFGIILLSLISFVHLSGEALKSKSTDFYAFYTAAGLLVHDKQNLYNPQVQYTTQETYFKEGYSLEGGFMAFVSLPLSAALYIPFLAVPPKLAAEMSQLLTLIAIILGVVRLYKFHKIKFVSWTTLVVAFFYPLYTAVHLGQISVFIFLILVEMYFSYMERKTIKLALLSSLLVLKYQYLVIIPLLFSVYPDRKNYLKVAAPVTVLLLLLNYLLMGTHLITQYTELMRIYQTSPMKFGMSFEYGMDIFSLFFYFFEKNANFASFLWMMVGLVLLHLLTITTLFVKRKAYESGKFIFCLIILYALIFSPHTMPADSLFLLIPIVGLFPQIKSPVLFTINSVFFSLSFFYTAYGQLWINTVVLAPYIILFYVLEKNNPGKFEKKLQQLFKANTSDLVMVGDPGIEPGTARV